MFIYCAHHKGERIGQTEQKDATVRGSCILGGGVPLYLCQPYPITHHLHALGKRDLGTHVNK